MHEIGIEWMTQTEVNGHFLELRGIPDEKLEWERIPEAIAGANYYNIQNIPGQLTVEPDSGHRHHLARLGIIGAQDLVHHRRAAFQARHRQMPEPIVRCRTVGAHRRGRGHLPRMRRHLPRGGRAAWLPEGVHRIRQSVHGRGMCRTPARMRVPMRREHDLLVAQARQDPTGRQKREGTAAVPPVRRTRAPRPA